jgi:hypothetical protein
MDSILSPLVVTIQLIYIYSIVRTTLPINFLYKTFEVGVKLL